jgi:hypothetical protein
MSYKTLDNVTWKNVSSGVVLLNLESGEYYTLNDTGSLIWTGLMENKTPAEIVSHMETEFDADAESIKQDYDEFMSYLLDEKLLQQGE